MSFSIGRFGLVMKSAIWVATCLVFYSSVSLAQNTEFSKLVVFGDSLSDTGNIALINLPSPYFRNRISDGPVGVDFIANSIGSNADASRHLFGSPQGFNYAVSGGNIVGTDPEDLAQQVNAHLQRVDQQTDQEALYVIIMGGNDLRDIRSITNAAIASQRISAVAAQLDTQIARLVDAGARAFLIANVPNVGRIPETLQRQAGDPTISARAEAYVREYNAVFDQVLVNYTQRDDLAVSSFDLFQALENILNNFTALGFRSRDEGCFIPSNFPFSFDNPPIELECLVFGFESRIFFDNIHPSSRTNELLAPQFIAALPGFPGLPSMDDLTTSENESDSVFVSAIIQLLLGDD